MDLVFQSVRMWKDAQLEKHPKLMLLSRGYILLDVIGQGAFAVIWRALCERKHENSYYIAIKISSNELNNSRFDVVSWLRNEYEVLHKVSGHPNIVTLFGDVRDMF